MTQFWKEKPLDAMSPEEWESLCDGCGRCCLQKLEDEDSGELHFTNVACHCLEPHDCYCTAYDKRTSVVPDCVVLRPEQAAQLNWLPSTCAYRLLAEGRDLPDWHPLVSRDPESVHRAGISVRDKTVSDRDVGVDAFEDHIVDWIS